MKNSNPTEPKPLSPHKLQLERNRNAIPDVEALIEKHGLAAVRSVVMKKTKIEAAERELVTEKARLEAELEKVKNQLK